MTPFKVLLGGRDLTATDVAGVDWFVGGNLTGWHAGPDFRVPRSPRDQAHGAFALQGYRTGRQVIVTGSAEAPDAQTAAAAALDLGSTLADGSFGTLEVTDVDGLTLWTFVQVADSVIDYRGMAHLRYQFTLWAADPFRYGDLTTASTGFASDPVGAGLVEGLFTDGFMDFGPLPTSTGTAAVSNAGTAVAYPVFRVAGPTPAGGFTITDIDTGAQVAFLGAVPAGSTIEIDARTGAALIDGVADRSGDVLVTTWPSVPPSGSATYRFAPASGTSTAILTVELAATYW